MKGVVEVEMGAARQPFQQVRVAADLDRPIVGLFGDASPALDAFVTAWRVPNLFRRLFGEGALFSGMREQEVRRLLRENLADVPGARFFSLMPGSASAEIASAGAEGWLRKQSIEAPHQMIEIAAPGFPEPER